jgi:hypothetical protein
MKSTMKTLLAILLSVTALGAGANAYADGYRDRDRWHDGNRYEQRWDDRRHDNFRRDGWYHREHYRYVYGDRAFFYGPPVVYPNRVYYGPAFYRNPGASVIIDLPPIIIR